MKLFDRREHSIKYNALMNFILTASNILFPLITFPYVSRVLLASGTGKIDFAVSISNYFLMIASLGIPTYGVRTCAKLKDDKEQLSKAVQEILIINAITTFFATAIFVICVFSIPQFKEDKTLFLIEGINVLLNFVGVGWLFQAIEQYDYITVRSIAFKIISIILMFVFVHQGSDYIIYAAISVFAAVGSNILNLIRMTKIISFKKYDDYNFRQHLTPIFILFAQGITVSIYTNLDKVMLGFITNDVEVGLYSAAVKIKVMLVTVVTSLGNVMLPRMSYYVKNNNKVGFDNLVITAINAVMLVAFPLTAFFTFESADCIKILAGESFYAAIPTMAIITMAVLPNGLTNIIGLQTLIPLGREKQVLYSVTVGAVSDLILNFVLIPNYGATGAAVATVIAELLVLLSQVYFAKDILIPLRRKIKLIRYFTCTMIAVVVYFMFSIVSIRNSFMRLTLTFFVFFTVYALELLIIKDELFLKLIGNRICHWMKRG